MPCSAKVGEHGQRLDGLAEPHLVADDDLLLHEREASTEALVGAQRGSEVVPLQLLGSDCLDDLLGEIAVHLLLVLSHEAEFGQHPEVVGRS